MEHQEQLYRMWQDGQISKYQYMKLIDELNNMDYTELTEVMNYD